MTMKRGELEAARAAGVNRLQASLSNFAFKGLRIGCLKSAMIRLFTPQTATLHTGCFFFFFPES